MKCLLCACAGLFVATFFSPLAMAQTEGRRENLRAPDGFPIAVTYYPFRENKDNPGASAVNAPVVILLHGGAENRLLWDKNSSPREQDPFPVLLQKRGYAVVNVDLRKHGDSVLPAGETNVGPNDYPAMVAGDLAAVKEFLVSEHQAQKLNLQKLGIIAIDSSAAVAAAFADVDWNIPPFDDAPVLANRTPRGQDVKALVLISPEAAAGRLKTVTALRGLKVNTPFVALMVVAGGQDQTAKKVAEATFEGYVPKNRRNDESTKCELLLPETKEKGMALFRQAIVYATVFKFLETNLKALDLPWRDRRSQLDR